MSEHLLEDRLEADESADAREESGESSNAAGLSGAEDKRHKVSRRVAISVRGLVVMVVVLLLATSTGILAWLCVDKQRQLDARDAEAAGRERAQQTATDYAVHAAEMSYQDFNGWKVHLVSGTAPELKEKLSKAADSMEQLLAPMQWTSTARALSSIAKSEVNGVYRVDSFVSVLTKTVQAPQGLQSTATYSVTIDSRNNWLITDVGGIDAALGMSAGGK